MKEEKKKKKYSMHVKTDSLSRNPPSNRKIVKKSTKNKEKEEEKEKIYLQNLILKEKDMEKDAHGKSKFPLESYFGPPKKGANPKEDIGAALQAQSTQDAIELAKALLQKDTEVVEDKTTGLSFIPYGSKNVNAETVKGLVEAELKDKVIASLSESLADKTLLVEEINRDDVVLPSAKDPKKKELPETLKEFVLLKDKKTIDVHHVRLLMGYMTQDELIELFGPKYINSYILMKKSYETRVRQLQATNPEIKPSVGKFKRMLLNLPSLMKTFLLTQGFTEKMWLRHTKKLEARNIKADLNKEANHKKRVASKLTAKPKRKFLGALLSKITPEQYREAMKEFNDPVKGKGMQHYANVTPGKMIKEIERQAYATARGDSSQNIANVLEDPDSYKADTLGPGVKRRIKDIETRLAGMTLAQKGQDRDYVTFVQPHLMYKSDESVLVGEIRSAIAKGASADQIREKLAKREEIREEQKGEPSAPPIEEKGKKRAQAEKGAGKDAIEPMVIQDKDKEAKAEAEAEKK